MNYKSTIIGIRNRAKQNTKINSKWVNKYSWGDIHDLSITEDKDKSVIYTIVSFNKLFVEYTITYDGNDRPDKIFKDTINSFIDSHNIKPIVINN